MSEGLVHALRQRIETMQGNVSHLQDLNSELARQVSLLTTEIVELRSAHKQALAGKQRAERLLDLVQDAIEAKITLLEGEKVDCPRQLEASVEVASVPPPTPGLALWLVTWPDHVRYKCDVVEAVVVAAATEQEAHQLVIDREVWDRHDSLTLRVMAAHSSYPAPEILCKQERSCG